MGLFSKENKLPCPLCDKKLGMLKFQLDNGDFICQNCAIDLSGVYKKDQDRIKGLTVTQLKDMYKQKGLDAFIPILNLGVGTVSVQFDDNINKFTIKPNLFLKKEYRGNYENISHYEVIENNSTKIKSGLGKAIAGGVIAGPAGMITGAIIGKNQHGPDIIENLSLNIHMKSNQHYPIEFITKNTKSDSSVAQNVWDTINQITNKLDEIIPQKTDSFSESKTVNNLNDLVQLKELLDANIITDEEFNAKKKQILNL